jgi:hypothetical protein
VVVFLTISAEKPPYYENHDDYPANSDSNLGALHKASRPIARCVTSSKHENTIVFATYLLF